MMKSRFLHKNSIEELALKLIQDHALIDSKSITRDDTIDPLGYLEFLVAEERINSYKFSSLEDGILGEYNPTSNLVFLSDKLNSEKIRKRNFTIAHEIGHFIIHKPWFDQDLKQCSLFKQPLVIKCFESNLAASKKENMVDRLEWQANYFASVLLLPKAYVAKFIHRLGKVNHDDLVEAIADKFNASLQATDIRMKELKLGKYQYNEEFLFNVASQ